MSHSLRLIRMIRYSFCSLAAAGCGALFAGTVVAGTELSIAPRAANPDQVELRWPSQTGKRYSIWAGTNLADAFELRSTGLQATQPDNVWWVNRGAPNVRLFRLATDETRPALPGLVSNGDFANGLNDWETAVNGAADATLGVINGEMVATIIEGDLPVRVQLRQLGIPLTPGQTYTLKFDARSVPLSREIDVRFSSTNGSPRITYFAQDSMIINPSMTTYTLSFTMTNTPDPFARVVWNLGGDTNDVVIDNVVLSEGVWFEERAESHEMARRMATGNNFMAAKAIRGNGAPEDAILLNQYHFAHCRFGYKMNEVATNTPDYTIPEAELRQLQDIVDYCLDQGLIAIVDPASNWANGPGYTHPDDLPKLQKIWEQVAARFESYPLDMVVFEILNEPHSGASVSNITTTGLTAIRSFPGNQKRQVVVSGEGFSTRDALINALDNDWIPANDPYLIGTFHYYDPRDFTKQGDPGGPLTNVNWGSPSEVAQIDLDFEAVTAANANWALRNGTEQLPIYLGEYGIDNFAPPADRKRWLTRVRMAAEHHGFASAHWNMYDNDSSSKGMGPWTAAERDDPTLRTFDAAPAEALMTRYEAEQGTLSGGVTIRAEQPGFSGAGYAQYPASTGATVHCEINGYIPTDDAYVVEIHYACPVSTTLLLQTFNDAAVTVDSQNVLFPATGEASSWATIEVSLNFQAGEDARLRLTADSDPGPNLDHVRFTR